MEIEKNESERECTAERVRRKREEGRAHLVSPVVVERLAAMVGGGPAERVATQPRVRERMGGREECRQAE
ncbi:hypothetical protein Sjap_011202 [Stephania japonica]|uniref:Uncharacterized protein n=1 Tax=Stephania japonica TaxID=461633 RepID=A0AAP0JC02_9MAGN